MYESSSTMDKEKVTHSLFKNRVGILATMHKKEEGPIVKLNATS
jgi:hypothetical protein